MASFSSLISLLLYTVLFAVPITGYPLDNICKQTKNPDFCFNLLKPHADASLQELEQIAIDTTFSSATKTSAKIQSLLSKTDDPKLKAVYNICSEEYSAALAHLEGVRKSLKSRDYGNMIFSANWIVYNASLCKQAFSKAPSQPIPIASDNNDLELLSNVLSVVSVALASSV